MSKTAFITGGSRGIGKAIALSLAKAGYNIVIAAKTAEAHPKLEGTIYTAAEEIEKLGVKVLPLQVDIRSEENVIDAVEKVKNTFGKIDVLVNNASAIDLSPTEHLSMKKFDLIHSINIRGTFMVSKYCIPLLKESENAHILTLSPPLNLDPKWFGKHLGYTLSKYGMSMTVLGLAEELKPYNIAVNALWPQTTIATAAVQNLLGGDALMQCSRTPDIMGDAAMEIFKKDSKTCTGNFFIDEDVLKAAGVTDFTHYAVNPKMTLFTDLFL
jgi:citronellol/citronellal dehydrogenase